ncbi:LLM class flavin-dependent oxidoreductase [Brevundimonas naejangsanensis]
MKSIFFHFQGYRDLPDDFTTKYNSVWVTPPNDELCDPVKTGEYFRQNLEELEYADEMGFDGLGVNEHHSNGYGYSCSPNLIAMPLARRKSDAAIVVLGATLPLYNPAIRVAEEFALLDAVSGGRLVAGLPVGSAMDTVGAYGTPPTQVRPKYYEAHDLIKQAWTRPGPFPFNGQYNKLRYVNPWPKPIQKPHPPVWLAGGGSVETWSFATDNNYTYNYLSFSGYVKARALMQGYWDQVEKAGLDDNPYRAGFAQIVLVADSDEEAEKLYFKHVQNFFAKALHIPPYFGAPPGFMSAESMRFNMLKGAKPAGPGPYEQTWADFIGDKRIIAGGPDRVIHELKEAATSLRAGHFMFLMQVQSMDTELTKYNIKTFAEKVMPHIRGFWDKQGYVDHWWPQGAVKPTTTARQPEAVA